MHCLGVTFCRGNEMISIQRSLTMSMLVVLIILTGCATETDKESSLVVKMSDTEKELTLEKSGETLSEALKKNGQNVAELQQKYQPSIPWDAKTDNVSEVTFQCNCNVKLTVSGKQVGTYKTTKSTVGEFLQEKKISITPWDEIKTPPNSKIVDGMNVVIDRVENKVSKTVEEIPFKKEEKKSDELAKGKEKVEKEGKKGKKIYEVAMTLRNGKPVMKDGKPVVKKRLVKEIKPTDELVVIGTKEEEEEEEETSTQTPSGGRTMNVQATGYTHTGNRTATGTIPKRGTIAVDPSVIPLGTRIYVPGYGEGVAEDTGGVVNGNIIDLFFETRQEAINWGRRNVQIKILN